MNDDQVCTCSAYCWCECMCGAWDGTIGDICFDCGDYEEEE